MNRNPSENLIIGGGVIGLSIARELHKRGARKVTVVDKSTVGAEASWAAAGMLAPNAETHDGDPIFELCTASNALYPQFAEELFEETGIDIELDRTGTLEVAFTEQEAEHLLKKFDWQRDHGVAVEPLSKQEILDLESRVSPNVHSGLRYPNDWQVENRKLVAALRRYCELNGIELFEYTEVTDVIIDGEELCGVVTPEGEMRADRTVITAGAWTSTLTRHISSAVDPIKPIRGQMICFHPKEKLMGHVIYSPRGYIVPRADGRVLVGATVEDVGFKKEVTVDAIESLRAAAVEIAPVLADFDIKEVWAGLRPLGNRELPQIGPIEGITNAFIATGHYRNGILLAPITARMIADEISRTQPQRLGSPASAG